MREYINTRSKIEPPAENSLVAIYRVMSADRARNRTKLHMADLGILPANVHRAVRRAAGTIDCVGGAVCVYFGTRRLHSEIHLPTVGDTQGIACQGAPSEDDRVRTLEIDRVR